MSNDSSNAPCDYEITVHGQLSPRRLHWFEGLTITNLPEGDTMLVVRDWDQAMLFGLLKTLRNLGVTLISVHQRPQTEGHGSPHG